MGKHYGMTFYGLYSPRVVEEEVLPVQKSVSLKFNPDQPRDENGRFAETDGSSLTVSKDSFRGAKFDELPKAQTSVGPWQMDAMLQYSNYGYEWMNSYLRTGEFPSDARDFMGGRVSEDFGKQYVEILAESLSAQETEEDLRVVRYQYGLPDILDKRISELTDEEVSGLVGNVYEAKGFTSTAAPEGIDLAFVNDRVMQSDVQMNILMPAGTKGGTIGNEVEQEFVLPPNTSFIVTGAERAPGSRISLDLLVVGQQ